MTCEKTPYGIRLKGRPYFPMYLCNGVDAMLINLQGSGDCWFELQTDYSAPLSALSAKGWYKCDRRVKKDVYLVYGRQFPLFEFSASTLLNGELIVPRNAAQYFDPQKAMLTTVYDQIDNETLEPVKVKVTTFLTRNHILVEHYEYMEAPASGAAGIFFINSPSEPYLHVNRSAITMDKASMFCEPENSLMGYEYELGAFKGGVRSWCDCACEKGRTTAKETDLFVYGELTTRTLKQGESFTRYLAVIDTQDSEDYSAALDAAMASCRRLGYNAILEAHVREWKAYFGTCSIDIPDDELSYLYDVSRYFLKANQHPETGFMPMGNLPYLWQNSMFWDACFAIEAWNGCGNTKESAATIANLETYGAEARHMASKHFGVRGARLEWTTELKTFTKYREPSIQIHNNAFWAHQIYSCFKITGDVSFLKQHIQMMEDLILFLVDWAIEDRGDHCIIRRCHGVDESTRREKTNDTWTCAVTLKALADYRDACDLLDREPAFDAIEGLIDKLERGLNLNVDDTGVMQAFQGGKLPHWGCLVFDLFPNHPSLKPTIEKMMENYDPDMKLYNFHGVTRYPEKAFPWADCWAARCLSRIGDPRAYQLLDNIKKTANSFGGLPERIWYHGELFKSWFMSAHAALVWALNGILASANGNTLRLLNGIPEHWRDVSFENVHAGEGLRVSCSVVDGSLTSLEINNLQSHERTIRCICPLSHQDADVTLKPGHNVIHKEREGADCLPDAINVAPFVVSE